MPVDLPFEVPPTAKRYAPATQRNRVPLAGVLSRFLPEKARVLELASGSGEHAVYLAPRLRVAAWQPTDCDSSALESIAAWRAETDVPQVSDPLCLNVLAPPWPTPCGAFDAVFTANLFHISPSGTVSAAFQGAAECVKTGGQFFVYGPFQKDGQHTAASNAAFHTQLRAQNGAWGIRPMEEVVRAGSEAGFEVMNVIPMPANNFVLRFVLTGPAPQGAV